jgi:CubicO group peptidase (beta-lactamase class C family)
VVPNAWVYASTRPDAPHLTPEAKAGELFPVGYGYQWWIPRGDEGECSAIGIYNQFVSVIPTHDVVIVKLSAFSGYAFGLDEDAYRELQTFDLFRAIVRALDNVSRPAMRAVK